MAKQKPFVVEVVVDMADSPDKPPTYKQLRELMVERLNSLPVGGEFPKYAWGIKAFRVRSVNRD